MITREHLRFLALMIPTWLLLGAIAVSFAVPSRGHAGAADGLIQAALASCNDAVGVATQQRTAEPVVAAEWYREYPPAVAEE